MSRLVAASVLAAVLPLHVNAAPIGFEFVAGVVEEIEPFAPPEILNFMLGETVIVEFSIDSNASDLLLATGAGEYEDPLGTIMLTGATSGSVLNLTGINVEFDDNTEFELRSDSASFDPNTGTPGSFVIFAFGDFDYLAPNPIISNPDDLQGSLAELEAQLVNGLFPQPNIAPPGSGNAFVSLFDQSGSIEIAMEIGRTPTAAIPLPTPAALLIGGLAALGLARRRA